MAKANEKSGKCLNVGNCSKANSREIININILDDFICPECENELEEVKVKESSLIKFLKEKWYLIVLILAVIGGGVFFYLKSNSIEPIATEIIFSDSKIILQEGEVQTISFSTKPENLLLEWSSSDPTTVSVNQGEISGLKDGEVEITASANGVSQRLIVRVNRIEEDPEPDSNPEIIFSDTEISLKKGDTQEIAFSTKPENLMVEWSSSEPTIVSVNNGKIKALKEGKAEITASTEGVSESLTVIVFVDSKLPPISGGGGTGELSFPYGKYVGDRKNGKANGQGKMTYTKRTLISEDDPKKRYAEAGEWVIGTWYDNKLDFGKLFGTDGNQKESLTIGQR